MNNAFIRLETPEEHPQKNELFGAKEAELVKVIEALQGIQASKEWSTLKQLLFEGTVRNLEARILAAAKEEDPDTNHLNRLSGQLEWAEKYADLSKLEARYRTELANVRLQLYGNTES